MRTLLPKTAPGKKGFTLIELMVVIAIIAIISAVGIAIFQGQQKNARDSRRRADIEAIAQAMEAQKTTGSTTYPVPLITFFSSGKMPIDPTNTVSGTTNNCGTACQYCYSTSATRITNCTGGTSNFWSDPDATPTGWTASATWTICANLESGTSFCRSNSQ